MKPYRLFQRLGGGAGGGSGDATAASIISKMDSWWPLDETSGTTATDVHGGHHGTHVNSPTLSSSGVTYNGSTQYTTLADRHLNYFTAGIRVKMSSAGDRKYIFNSWSGSGGFAITTREVSPYGLLRTLVTTSPGGTTITYATADLADNSEHIILLTRTNAEIIVSSDLFADVVHSLADNPLVDSANPITIGRNAAGGDYWPGRAVEAFICAALTADERDFIINGGDFRGYADLIAAS